MENQNPVSPVEEVPDGMGMLSEKKDTTSETPTPDSPETQNLPSFPKSTFNKKLLIWVILSIILLVSLIAAGYFYYKSQRKMNQRQTSSVIQKTSSPTPSNNQETYKDKDNNFSFKYPLEFTLNQDGDVLTLFSAPVLCKTNAGGSELEVSVSEITMTMKLHSGESYEEIWKDTFGTEFNNSSYDGKKEIAGKTAYYFFTGAESVKSKESLLINISEKKALEIIIEKPLLVDDCEGSIERYEGAEEEILSTLEFND